MVWQVIGKQSVMYLGGTIHVLRDSDYPLPARYAQAYQAADILVFETDLQAMHKPSTQALLLDKAQYQDGRVLQQVLSRVVYQKLHAYSLKAAFPLQQYARFKPGYLMMLLLFSELQKKGITAQSGVDFFYFQQALADKKPVTGLEEINTHLDFIANLGEDNADALVLNTLDELTTIETNYGALLKAWRNADESALQALLVAGLQVQYPKIHQQLLLARNIAWLQPIEQYLKDKETEFVLVGAAHLVGEGSVVELLKRKGYSVTRLPVSVHNKRDTKLH